MQTGVAAPFGKLLRQFRLAAGLTQDQLAERSGLSIHGIQKLERGATHPYRDTAARLDRALQLLPDERAMLLAAVRPVRRHGAPTPTSADVVARQNLPIPTTTFVARAGEMERVMQRLREARLLTITGSGGCGKTRLAVEVARQLVGDFPDGVWLVDLAPLVDASLVASTIATNIGLLELAGREPLAALTDHLRSRRVLLILDNCEHVVDASAEIVDTLLRACAGVQILTTSRELLGVSGEATWPVKSLSTVGREGLDCGAVLETEAGRLFLDRAQLVVPSFAITDRNAPAVAQVCNRLDGIPLAIELAAARLVALTVDQVADRLDHRFRLLTGGHRTSVRRQQTLEATIDWSYELLSDAERSLLRALSVFSGGWSLAAAECLGLECALDTEHVLELLSRLVSKSTVVFDEPRLDQPGTVRYRFLETIRQYAAQKLLEAGDADRVRVRHAEWYLSLADEAVDGMEGPNQLEWLDRLELEHDNFRAALGWTASDPTRAPQLLHLAASLGRFWQWRCHAREGITWLDMALAQNTATPSSDRARALNWRAVLARVGSGTFEAWRPFLQESIAQARAVGDGRVLSMALRHTAIFTRSPEERPAAAALLQEALLVSRQLGLKREIAWNLGMVGALLAVEGQLDAAEPLIEESIRVGRESGDPTPVLHAIQIQSAMCCKRGELARGRSILEDGLALGRERDMLFMLTGMLITLGDLASAETDWAAAGLAYREALQAAERGAPRRQMATAARRYAATLVARRDHRPAVRLFSASSSATESWYPLVVIFDHPPDLVTAIATAREALGEAEFAREWAAGQSLTLEQAIAEALTSGV